MKVEITYPHHQKHKLRRSDVIRITRLPFILAMYICLFINLMTGGKAWSLIVVYSLWIIWSNVISTDLVEYNRISQLIKLIIQSSILMFMIDAFLAPGWAMLVVPIVCFSGLAAAGVLLFSNLKKQRHNMMPMLLLSIVSLIGSIIGLILWREESRWVLTVMAAVAFTLLLSSFYLLGTSFLQIVRKHFHIQ